MLHPTEIMFVFSLCGRHKWGGGRGCKKGEREKGRNACYNNCVIPIMPTDFLVIELCELSICSAISNWHAWCGLLRMADFTQVFSMFTVQHKLANQNFLAARVLRNELKGVFIAGVLSLSFQLPFSGCLLCRLVCFTIFFFLFYKTNLQNVKKEDQGCILPCIFTNEGLGGKLC